MNKFNLSIFKIYKKLKNNLKMSLKEENQFKTEDQQKVKFSKVMFKH